MLRSMQALAVALIAALASPALGTPARGAEQSVVVLDFELVDTSLDGQMLGTTDAEFARLAAVGERLRVLYENDPDWRIVRDEAVLEKARAANLQSCGDCYVKLGREAGADVVVTGVVQKVSNLILSITIYAHSTESGELVGMAGADIRGNTDQSWMHGLQWLAKNRLRLAVLKAG